MSGFFEMFDVLGKKEIFCGRSWIMDFSEVPEMESINNSKED